jgi:hypothetical protein
MQTLSLNVLTRLSRSRAPPALFTRAFGWNVGDAVPVNYMKDGKAPVIKEDTEYPDWVATLANPLQTKTQLLNKVSPSFLFCFVFTTAADDDDDDGDIAAVTAGVRFCVVLLVV